MSIEQLAGLGVQRYGLTVDTHSQTPQGASEQEGLQRSLLRRVESAVRVTIERAANP